MELKRENAIEEMEVVVVVLWCVCVVGEPIPSLLAVFYYPFTVLMLKFALSLSLFL